MTWPDIITREQAEWLLANKTPAGNVLRLYPFLDAPADPGGLTKTQDRWLKDMNGDGIIQALEKCVAWYEMHRPAPARTDPCPCCRGTKQYLPFHGPAQPCRTCCT